MSCKQQFFFWGGLALVTQAYQLLRGSLWVLKTPIVTK